MVKRGTVFILLFLILLSGNCYSQQVISTASCRIDYRVPYRPGDNNGFTCGNVILRELAKEVLREPWLVSIDVSCKLHLTVTREEERSWLAVSLDRLHVGGDTVFRRFPVNDVMLPSRISLKLRWANIADTSGYAEETLAGIPVPDTGSLVCRVPVASFNPLVDTLIVRNVEFQYDSVALRAFLERLGLIHDYYASLLLLDSLQNFTGDLHLDQAGLLPYNYLKIEETGSVLKTLASRDFQGRLLRSGYDPSGYARRYQQLFRHSRTIVYNLVDEMRRTGAIPWDGDAGRLASYFTSRVLSYVRRSFLMDQQQGSIYADCLDHFFDAGTFPSEERVAESLLAKMFPDARQDTVALFVAKQIAASYQATAKRLMEENQYAEAFSMLQNRRRFMAGIPAMAGFENDDVLQSKAAEGIYNSYVGIAATCISNRKLSMAGTYLSKADQYARAHTDLIRSDSAYRSVFSELFFLRNADCDEMLNQKKYADALECYRQFEKTYSARDLALVSMRLNEKKSIAMNGLEILSARLSTDALKRKNADTALFYYEKATALRQETKNDQSLNEELDSLAPVMARIKWQQIFREGSLALEKRRFTLAVNLLKEARLLADKYRMEASREFDSTYRQAMKYYLIVQLSSSQKKIWDNQFDSAQVALQRTEATGFDFGLLNDPDLVRAMDNFKLKTREQHCRNLQDSVNLRMIRADRSIALRNYLKALVYLNQALDFCMLMPGCNIAGQPVKDSIAKYIQAAGYQQKQADAGSLAASGNYEEAVTILFENQHAFNIQNLGRFGLQMVENFDYFRERNNPYFTEKAISYSIGTRNFSDALRFLILSHDQGLPARTATPMQKELGIVFAADDHRHEPQSDPLVMVLKHVPAGEWFGVFRKSYLTEWNRLAGDSHGGRK